MATATLIPPYVNLQRIPQHYINFTYAHIVKRAYLPYCIQYNVTTEMIMIIIGMITIMTVLIFGFLVFNFAIILVVFICYIHAHTWTFY